MADTTFTDSVTVLVSSWCQDINNAVYRGIGLSGATSIASATTPDIFAATTSHVINYTGTGTATGFVAAPAAGASRILVCAGASIFTAGANMIIDGTASGSNFTATANQRIIVVALTTTQFMLSPLGLSVSASPITNSLGADVALNNTGLFFDGPSVAQGTSGTWFVSGTVTVTDTAGIGDYLVKLWDGTTVIASTGLRTTAVLVNGTATLSGYISSPAGNLRISVRDTGATTGKILFNVSGLSKDSTITAIRIA